MIQKKNQKHNLNHLPYANWCPSCVKGKGRPDSHKENAEKHTKRSLPRISFDLFYTSKKVKEPMVEVGEKEEISKLVFLALVDSLTGAVSAVPLLNKGDPKMMAKEIVRFVQWLAYSSLSLRFDQEPTTLQVQQLCQQSLSRLGVKAVLENLNIQHQGFFFKCDGGISSASLAAHEHCLTVWTRRTPWM